MPVDRAPPLSPSGQQSIILCLALEPNAGNHWHHDHALVRRRDLQTYENAIQSIYSSFPTLHRSVPIEVHTRSRLGGELLRMNELNWKGIVRRKTFNELLVSQTAGHAHFADESGTQSEEAASTASSTIPEPPVASSSRLPAASQGPSASPTFGPLFEAMPTPTRIIPPITPVRERVIASPTPARPISPLPTRRASTSAAPKASPTRRSGLRHAIPPPSPSPVPAPNVFSITVELLAGTKRVFKNLLPRTTVLELKAMIRADVGMDMEVQEMRLYVMQRVDDGTGKRKETEMDLEDGRTLDSYGRGDGQSMVYIGTAKKRRKGRSSWAY